MGSFVSGLAAALPDTVIFGGMLREFSLGKSREFCSDLDLVTCQSAEKIESVLSAFNWQKNRFGGYRVCVHGWQYDLWSLKDTWAARAGHVECSSFDDLLDTTFFDIDSAAFHISSRKLIVSSRHLRAVSSRVLGINLVENPSPRAMAKRAVRMALENDFSLTRELAEYVIEHHEGGYSATLEAAYVRSLESIVSATSAQTIHPVLQPDFFADQLDVRRKCFQIRRSSDSL